MAGPATRRSPGGPKKPPPKPAKTNAFALQDPMTAPFKTTPHQRAVVKEIRKREGSQTASIMAGRTGALAGLPAPGGFGMTGDAKDKYQVNLTAKAELAKANVERRTHGGLLTAKQRKREKEAEKIVVGTLPSSFAERHDLHNATASRRIASSDPVAPSFYGDLTPPAVHLDPPKPPARGSFHPPATLQVPERRAQPAYGARGGAPGGNPYIAKKSGSGGGPLDWASLGLGTALEAAAAIPGTITTPMKISYGGTGGLGTAAHPPIMDVKPTRLPAALTDTTNRAAVASNEAASRISGWGLSAPKVDVKLKDILPSGGVDTASYAATTGKDSIPADQLGAAGFTPEATERYIGMAVKRGWYRGELANLNGLDLLEHAYNDPPPMLLRLGQNFASGVARTGSAGAAIYGLAREHDKKTLGQFAEAAGSYVGALAHPKEAIVSDPYGYLPLPGLALKGLGTVGYLTKAADKVGVRAVRVGEGEVKYIPSNEMGPQQPGYSGVIERGTYSRNLATAAAQHLSDRAAEMFGKNAALSKHVDTLVRRATNAKGAEHQMAQLAYRKAQKAVGRKRAEILLALQHAGGDANAMADLYDAQALKHEKGAKSPAAGAAAYYRNVVAPATKTLSDADKDFLAAHELISEHTSNTLIGLGRFSQTAKIYRQHEPLILAAAERAISKLDAGALHADLPEIEAQALHLLFLRKELDEVIPSDAPSGVRISTRKGKRLEAERASRSISKDRQRADDILNDHAPPVMPKRQADPEYDAAVAEHKIGEPTRRAKGTVKNEPPPEPKGPQLFGNETTKAAAERTAKTVRADNPDATVEVRTHGRGDYSVWVEHPKGKGPKVKATRRAMTEEELDAEHAAAVEAHGKAKPKRRPLNDDEKAALAAYRAEKADWDKNWKTKWETAKIQSRSFGKSERGVDRRAGALSDAERIEARSVPDTRDIRAQYDDAVREFARQHVEGGGMAPSRVAYSRRETYPGVRRMGQGARGFMAKPGGTQAKSTGKSFLSGNYLIDSKSPILENLRAQRLEASIGSYHQVMQHLAVEAKKNEPVPDGMIFVKGSNLAAVGKIEHEMESNPVSHGDHYASEHSIREDFTNALKGATQKGQVASEDGFFVPAGAWRRMVEYTTPESQGVWQKFLRQYQRVLISTFPGTIIGNAAGTVGMAAASGAGYRSFRDATRAMKDPTLAPATLRGRGVAGGLASEAHNVASQYMDFMRRQSVKGEDWNRLAGYFSKAGPHIRREAEKLGMEADDYARAFAKGEVDPRKLDEFLNHAEEFMGDTVRPNGKAGRFLGNFILFHNWVGHMAKLMLYTLPVKHPGTAVVINMLANYGDQYRREHGIWPGWMTDYVPLPKVLAGIGNNTIDKVVPGGTQHFTRALNIGQLMPQSTAGGLLQNLAADRPWQERIATATGPGISQALSLMEQEVINKYGSESNQADFWKTAVNLALGMVPGFRKAFPMQGRKPDDLSIFGKPSYKMYTSQVPGMPLSPFLQPGAVPDRGVSGFFERAFGTGVYNSPTQGPITDVANSKNILRHVKETASAPRAKIMADRKKRLYESMRKAGVPDPQALVP